jgi:hypothetical protein
MESSKSDDNSGKLTPAWSADIAVGDENVSEHGFKWKKCVRSG